MSLLDEAKAASPRKGPACGAGRFLAAISDEMRTETLTALYSDECTDAGLIAALTARGFDPPALAVWGHHRRGGCKCEPYSG